MKRKILTLAIAIIMAQATLTSCGWNVGQGDKRDRNIGIATLDYLDSIPDVEYIGLADTHDLEDGKFQAIVIFNVNDATGNKTEHNARVLLIVTVPKSYHGKTSIATYSVTPNRK